MKLLKKIVLEDGNEYLDSTELIDEMNDRDFKMYSLGKPICDVLNYFQENSPDAFGNAPYARLEGYMYGYIHGRNMELEQGEDLWIVRKGKHKILAVEVPKKPQSYYDDLKDVTKTLRDVFGNDLRGKNI